MPRATGEFSPRLVTPAVLVPVGDSYNALRLGKGFETVILA